MTNKKKSAPHTQFGKTKVVPIRVVLNGEEIDSGVWDEVLWVERGEDWYALSSSRLKNKRVRIIERDIWLTSPELY